MNRTHEMKCWPENFAAVRRREKTFGVCFNDRDYRAGDTLILREWIPPERWIEQYQGDGYTGEKETVTVTYVLDDPRWCKPGYVVLGLGFERWISVKERLPETRQRILVLINCENHNRRITCAKYIAPRSVLAEDFIDEDSWEFLDYDEETDKYWTPSGFYESNYYTDANYFIDDAVTHWQPLPAPPKEEKK